MSNHVIEIKGVSKSYSDQPILHDIHLAIQPGEFITLLGPSGCGKTTLLRLISGFEQPDSGQILINNKDMAGVAPHHRHVHTVFQSYALFPHMTVFDNIAFGLRCHKTPKQEIEPKVMQALSMVKLQDFRHRKPAQLSGGQQQRVAIARAVVNQPTALLLDEPLSSLDYRLRKAMQLELKQLQRQLGITFIFVTHDQEEALSMSDRVVVMQEGFIQQIGTPREVYENPKNLTVANFIGEVNLFECEILKVEGENCFVNIENHYWSLPNRNGFTVNEKINVLIRPEDIRVWCSSEVDAAEKKAMFPGVVEEVIYKGSTVDLMVRLESGKLIAATEFFDEDDSKLEYRFNEPVWISWLPGWEVVLPYEK